MNEPVPTPLGGVHCLLLGEAALQSYDSAWATAPAESRGGDVATTPGPESWSTVYERVLGHVYEAEHECSAAANDRQRQGIQEMRRALALVRAGLTEIAAFPPGSRGAAPPNHAQI